MKDRHQGSAARMTAGVVAAVTAFILAIRLSLRLAVQPELLGALWHLAQYFTVLTNTLVMIAMLLTAAGRRVPPRAMTALTVSILCVGLVYHIVLAKLTDYTGIELFVDHGLHTIVPALTLVWRATFAQRTPLRRSDPVVWTVWPLGYCAYILLRGAVTGVYPYPFLNAAELGAQGVAVNIVALTAAFVAVGLALSFLARLVPRRASD